MTRSMSFWKLMLVCSFLALPTATSLAQEKILWRTDYNAARKEAEAKNLPMVIDFTTIACFYCDKMDRETFSDPRIISTGNERFVPLKINHKFDPSLGTHLKIDRFPTIVVASPDGRVLDKRIGFQDADKMNELLQTTLATLSPGEAIPEKYLAAVRQEAAGEYARAVSNLRDLLDDVRPRAITKDARALLSKIEKRADERLSLARDLQNKGKNVEALELYTEIVRTFPSLNAGREASELIVPLAQAKPEVSRIVRNKKARELMDQANSFYKSEDYIPCLDRCDLILANFADLPEGQEAHLLAARIKNNPDWLQKAADVTADRLGGLYLALADSHLKRNEVRLAQHWLQRVVTTFPGSRFAESAQLRMNQLEGTVPIRADVPLVSRPK